jgi:dihydroorotase
MLCNYHITNARIVNEGRIFKGEVLVCGGHISKVLHEHEHFRPYSTEQDIIRIDAGGKYLIPGVIDDQVHFRDPGLAHKGDIFTESRAAVAGGVTSYMDMPNTMPPALSQELLEEKYLMASEKSLANFSFYMGTSNENIEEVLKTDPARNCGIKIFMGASTGNLLVDDPETLDTLFKDAPALVAVHCEDESTIRKNAARFREKYGDDIPVEFHPEIRSEEACYRSSSLAVSLARKYGTRLHVLHLSTANEMVLFEEKVPLKEKQITGEVCVHHLWFSDEDYKKLGTKIKWNPAIKSVADRDALWQALKEGRLDVVATDHAPHTLEEKSNTYFKAPSGGPLVQHSLVAMLEMGRQRDFPIEKVVEKMCHAPAECFGIENRGYIREGYYADLVMVDPENEWKVSTDNIFYKCGWSPFENTTFHSRITHTFVNGRLVYDAGKELLDDVFDEKVRGERLTFKR